MNKVISKCPDFNLGKLIDFGPGKLIPKQNLEDKQLIEFMLALAVIFNDFKGLEWWLVQLKKGQPPNDCEETAYLGQWWGVHVQITRLILGLFHELIVLVEKNLKIVNSPSFCLLINSIPNKQQKSWKDLVSFAKTWKAKPLEKERGSLNAFLHRIRSKTVFHYDQEHLQTGYRERFCSTTNKEKQRAFVAMGGDIDATRFFYADAAAQEAMIREFNRKGLELTEIQRFRELLASSLMVILNAFLKSREILQ